MSRFAYTIAAAIVLVLLTASHWKVYHLGKTLQQAQYNAAVAAATERARAREHALSSNVEKLDHELQKQKARNAAVNRAHADRLREYQAALERATAQGAAAPGAVVSPFAAIAGQCGAALAAMDEHARELALIAEGLQRYTAEVCVAK